MDINDYVCNLIAGRLVISNFYDAVDRAREVRNFNGGQFCYTLNLPGIGCKTYKGGELIRLDNRALCLKVSDVFSMVDDVPTIEQAALLLLIQRKPIRKLYQTFYKALFMRSTVRIFCIEFKNPFEGFVMLNKNCVQYRGPEFLRLFCLCSDLPFDPLTVFGVTLNLV